MSEAGIRSVFKVAVGFFVGTLVFLAGALYLSTYYLDQQQRLTAAGDTREALQTARLAARLNPFDSAPLVAEAGLLQQRGQFEEAAGVLEEATRRDPADYANYVALGNLRLSLLDDPEAAAKSYREALERNPREPSIISALAGALTRAGDPEGAKREYEKLEALDRISLQDLYNLGKIYTRTGEPEKGVETFRNAKERAEARLERSEGQNRAQMEAFARSVDLAIADSFVAQGRYEEAKEVLAASDSEQAPAIIELLNTDPETYRETVLDGED